MTPPAPDLEARIRRLEDLEAIRRVKYRYWRCLDLKLWDEMAECLTEDVEASWGEGRYRFSGREAVLDFLRRSLGTESGAVTIHQGHHPEIDLTSETSARGRWSLYNYMMVPRAGRGVREAAFYEDEYVKLDGAWRIRRTGYRYVFHEEWNRDDSPSLRLMQPVLPPPDVKP